MKIVVHYRSTSEYNVTLALIPSVQQHTEFIKTTGGVCINSKLTLNQARQQGGFLLKYNKIYF